MALADVRAIATLRSRARVQAGAGPLTGKNQILQGDQDLLINSAVQDYSHDEPREILLDLDESVLVDVGGVKHYKLASWDFDVSSESEIEIEFPVDQARRRILRRGYDLDYEIVERPSGVGGAREAWIKFYNPPDDSGGDWRIRYFTRWPDATEDGTLSVFDRRQDQLVGILAAVYTCRFLAAHFGHTDDPTLAVDTVAYRTKADEWNRMAKELWTEYQDKIDRPSRIKRAGQDMDVVDLDLSVGRSDRFGRDFLVHRRRRR